MRKDIENYCSTIGKNLDFVQGAGGNVSWKDGKTLWIKASGTWLADSLIKDIFVPVALNKIHHHLKIGEFDIKPELLSSQNDSLRPSIETILHAVMPQKVVSHTHLFDALVYLIQADPLIQLEKVMKSSLTWGVVPYSKPGENLAKSVFELLKAQVVDVIFLSNHGVIIGGDSVEDIEEKYQLLRKDLAIKFIATKTIFKRKNHAIQLSDYKLCLNDIHQGLALDMGLFPLIKKRWALYPDHIVFLGAKPSIFSSIENFNKCLATNDKKPDYAIIPDYGVYVDKDINANKLAMLDLFYKVLKYSEKFKRISVLSEANISELINWDAESYRITIAK